MDPGREALGTEPISEPVRNVFVRFLLFPSPGSRQGTDNNTQGPDNQNRLHDEGNTLYELVSLVFLPVLEKSSETLLALALC